VGREEEGVKEWKSGRVQEFGNIKSEDNAETQRARRNAEKKNPRMKKGELWRWSVSEEGD
jgi:hypothetical protein